MAVEIILRNAALTKAVDAFYKQKAGEWGWAILGQAYRVNEARKGGRVRLRLHLLDEAWAQAIRSVVNSMDAATRAAMSQPPKPKRKTKARKHK